MFDRKLPPLLISTIVHAALLVVMGLFKLTSTFEPTLDTVLASLPEEQVQQDFQQDLSLDYVPSDRPSLDAGSRVTEAIAVTATEPLAQAKVEKSEALKDPPQTVISIADIAIPQGVNAATGLAFGEVAGEVGVRADGYGMAMSRMTQELLRMMRTQPVMVVWLFDASISLRDDRREISRNFDKIYEELRIAQDDSKSRGNRYSPLETMVYSYGENLKKLLPRLTGNAEEIKQAIRSVVDDQSGVETTFTSIGTVIEEYGPMAVRSRRKLAVVVVTDETGDDDQLLEEAIARAKKYRTPVYFMSREAVFGYPHAQIRWTDPQPPHLTFWVTIDRGPETAMAECLQYDGLHARDDSASSGFGPYAQVRLAKESGGIFFLLSGAEGDLAGRASVGAENTTTWRCGNIIRNSSRAEYAKERDRSEFRRTIAEVIAALNPRRDKELVLRRYHYSMNPAEYRRQVAEQFTRARRSLALLNEGIRRLEKIEPLRARESEPRWRAAYDLCLAQLLSYRVRQFQFLLTLDQHLKNPPEPKNPESNRWTLSNRRTLLPPDEEQVKATNVDLKELEEQRKLAVGLYDRVIQEHPSTPWSRRAEQEKGWGFGFAFRDVFLDLRREEPEYRARIPKF